MPQPTGKPTKSAAQDTIQAGTAVLAHESFLQQFAASRNAPVVMAILLAIVTVIAFAPLAQNGFLDYDDDVFVTNNPHVTNGLTQGNVRWAFSREPQFYWRPLTWLSMMLDWQLFGSNAGAHHLSSLALHVASTILFFFVLHRMTRALWRSGLAAALFGFHPLHVEPVAWVSDRVDVLSGFFWMLTLWAYVRYAERQDSDGPRTPKSRSRFVPYASAVVFFALGLMAKPTIITLPFVLLLLDFWPLERMGRATSTRHLWFRLVVEKLPFFALGVGAILFAVVAEKHSGLVISVKDLPLSSRVANAVFSYFRYVRNTVWPLDLAAYYPHPGNWPAITIAGALLVLVMISAGVFMQWRRRYLLVGWLWFLGTLLPVIGLVQVGTQSMADRYVYLPLVGLLLIIIWGMADCAQSWRSFSVGLRAGASLALLLVCAIICRIQAGYWKNTERLFRHALAVTGDDNMMAHQLLANAFARQGQLGEAETHYLQLIRLKPNDPVLRNDLGKFFSDSGQTEKALQQYQMALAISPDANVVLNNIAWIRATHADAKYRDGKQAVLLAKRAAELTQFKNAGILDTLAAAYAENSEFDNAVATAEKALALAAHDTTIALAPFKDHLQLYRAGKPLRQ